MARASQPLAESVRPSDSSRRSQWMPSSLQATPGKYSPVRLPRVKYMTYSPSKRYTRGRPIRYSLPRGSRQTWSSRGMVWRSSVSAQQMW